MRSMTPLTLTLGLVLSGLGCGDATSSDSATLGLGEFCAPSQPEACPNGMCRDVVSGESCDSYSCANWDLPAIEGTICTKTCSSDSDCTGIDFAGTNGEQVSSEQWSCAGGICRVFATPPDSGPPTDICSGCGGALCAGRCIGCPQC